MSEFHRKRASSDGLNGRCKPCNRAVVAQWQRGNPDRVRLQRAKWKRENPDKVNADARKRYRAWRDGNSASGETFKKIRAWRYGIKPEDYVEMLELQDGRCLICGYLPKPGERYLAIDHDHETGTIRGLLCNPCNRGLGLLGDDPDRLVAAASYLLERR